ncbi:uncharacterized protein AKAW2_11821A [Aspergillus luchuensis]|uniref:Mmc1 C-terminal domain-containing protein n=2 Tax=Aspergillus kawachii TaxID=1069201 RepID=A0A1M3TUF3_ASPLC|nr:uncharacterized protein AKAW2_11821A [Aspergillus luchuensis]OJZ90449.1 hypothetical protein ASPFODRAFT_202983 [Aspergillus luchuensis CBS 106.47]GAA86198.1 similar to An07g03630 [Aspergillus luchuensis IFO 4308]BCR94775.1 hypothetical protein AKAW2_11821A [Aspergillus luchuensis]BCS07357.1 hypothetical protein ALUC_11738A [Aspergillus luchuensis]GAT19724.1 similar to An07g03630 [Aspergillus luchuensis]
MPPKLRGTLSKSLSQIQDSSSSSSSSVFYCPSCSTWRRSLSSRRTRLQLPQQQHQQQSWASLQRSGIATTSVVHTRHIPPRLKDLHEALNRVKDVAPEQVNLSRLQLALRGLESEKPVVRVAVLGLNDATAARRLVRLLLADPLNSRESWEDALDAYGEDTERGLLIRYGEVSETIPNDLLPTISVPSPILKKGNLEILVTTLGAESAGVADATQSHPFTADTFLVPTVTIRTSHSGRHNMVRYPVHRSIVCGSGVDGFLAYSGLMARSDLKKEAVSVFGAIELAVTEPQKYDGRVAFVDIDKADEALAKFRESVQNASLYERGWNSSGVQPVVDWLSSLRAEEGTLDPSLRTLITSLLDAAEAGAAAAEKRKLLEQESGAVSWETRDVLERSVSEWAERGHTELRSSLEEGFASKPWRGLAWWKLFWHVDDVGMITSEILDRKYLRQAEKEVIWTAGRFQQAGLTDATPMQEEQTSWPAQIATSRRRLMETTVPSLQALAQRLVFFSMSTTTLTSALSALTYVSLPTATIYETCTMAAIGLIYSLRNQQRKWESARHWFENEVREDGRTALLETETQLRETAREGGRQVEEVTAEKDARETIERARTALEEVN